MKTDGVGAVVIGIIGVLFVLGSFSDDPLKATATSVRGILVVATIVGAIFVYTPRQ